MFTKNLSIEYGANAKAGILCLALDPGPVATDMSAALRDSDQGKKFASMWMTPEDCVSGLMKVQIHRIISFHHFFSQSRLQQHVQFSQI